MGRPQGEGRVPGGGPKAYLTGVNSIREVREPLALIRTITCKNVHWENIKTGQRPRKSVSRG